MASGGGEGPGGGPGPAWKSWLPKMSKTARLVGMAVLAVPAVVWLRKAVTKKTKDQEGEDNHKQENGLSREEIEQNEMEAYASQIVASVVSQALEQYQREMERVQ